MIKKQKTQQKLGELCESGVVARVCLWTVDDRRGVCLSIQLTQDGNTQRNGHYLNDGDSYCFIPCLYFDLNVAAILKKETEGAERQKKVSNVTHSLFDLCHSWKRTGVLNQMNDG